MERKIWKLIILVVLGFFNQASARVTQQNVENEPDGGQNTEIFQENVQTIDFDGNLTIGSASNTAVSSASQISYNVPNNQPNKRTLSSRTFLNTKLRKPGKFMTFRMPMKPLQPRWQNKRRLYFANDAVGRKLSGARSVSGTHNTRQTRPWSMPEALNINVNVQSQETPSSFTSGSHSINQQSISTPSSTVKLTTKKYFPQNTEGTSFMPSVKTSGSVPNIVPLSVQNTNVKQIKDSTFRVKTIQEEKPYFGSTGSKRIPTLISPVVKHKDSIQQKSFNSPKPTFSATANLNSGDIASSLGSLKSFSKISHSNIAKSSYSKTGDLSQRAPSTSFFESQQSGFRSSNVNTGRSVVDKTSHATQSWTAMPSVTGSLSSMGTTTLSSVSQNVQHYSSKSPLTTSLTSISPPRHFKESSIPVTEVYDHNMATNLMTPNFVSQLGGAVDPVYISHTESFVNKIKKSNLVSKEKYSAQNKNNGINDSKRKTFTALNTDMITPSGLWKGIPVKHNVNNIKNGLGTQKSINANANVQSVDVLNNNDINPRKADTKGVNIPFSEITNTNNNLDNSKAPFQNVVAEVKSSIKDLTNEKTKQQITSNQSNIQYAGKQNKIESKRVTTVNMASLKDTWPSLNTKSPLKAEVQSVQESLFKQNFIANSKAVEKTLDTAPAVTGPRHRVSSNFDLKALPKGNKIHSILITSTHRPTSVTTTLSPDVFKISNFSLDTWIKGDRSKPILDVSGSPKQTVTKFWTPTTDYLRALKKLEKRKRIRNENSKLEVNMKTSENKTETLNLQSKQSNRISRAINTHMPIQTVTAGWYDVPPYGSLTEIPPQFQDIPPISLDSVIGTQTVAKASIKAANSWGNTAGGNIPSNNWDSSSGTNTAVNDSPNVWDPTTTTTSIDSIVGTRSFDTNTPKSGGASSWKEQTIGSDSVGSNTDSSLNTKPVSSATTFSWSTLKQTNTNGAAPSSTTKSWSQSPSWIVQASTSVQWDTNTGHSSGTGSTLNSNVGLKSGSGSSPQWDQQINVNSRPSSSQIQHAGSNTGTTTSQRNQNTGSNTGTTTSQWNQSTGRNTGTSTSQWNQNTASKTGTSTSQWNQNTASNSETANLQWNQNAGHSSQVNQNTGSNKGSGSSQWDQNTGVSSIWDQNAGRNTGSSSLQWNQNTGTGAKTGSSQLKQNKLSNTGSGSSQWDQKTGGNRNTGSNKRTNPWERYQHVESTIYDNPSQWGQNTGSGSKWNQNAGSNTDTSSSQWNQNTASGSSKWNQNIGKNTDTSSLKLDQNTGSGSSKWNKNTGNNAGSSSSQWDIQNGGNAGSSSSQWKENTGSNLVSDFGSNWNRNSGSSSLSGSSQWGQSTGASSQWDRNTGSNTGSSSSQLQQNTATHSNWNQNTGSNSGSQWQQESSQTNWNQNQGSAGGKSAKWNSQNRGAASQQINQGSSWNQAGPSNTNNLNSGGPSSIGGPSNFNQPTNANAGFNNGPPSQWNQPSGRQWTQVNNNPQTPSTSQLLKSDATSLNLIGQEGLLSGGVQTRSQGVVITKPEPPTRPPPPTQPPPPPYTNQWSQNWGTGTGGSAGSGGGAVATGGGGWHSAHQKGWVEIPQHSSQGGNFGNTFNNNNNPQNNNPQNNNPQSPQPGHNYWNPGFNNQQNSQRWNNNGWYPTNEPPPTPRSTTTTPRPTPPPRRPPERRWNRRTHFERMRERRYQNEMRRRRMYQRRLNRNLATGDLPEGVAGAVHLNNLIGAVSGRNINPQEAMMAVMMDIT